MGALMLGSYALYQASFFQKTFSYIGGAPICKIKAIYENAKLCHITPKASFVEEHFDIETTKCADIAHIGDTHTVYTITAKARSIAQDKWELRHVTNYLTDATCQIKMYAKKNELPSTRSIIAKNAQSIEDAHENIKSCLQAQDNLASLRLKYKSNQQKLQQDKKQLIRQQQVTTVYMLDHLGKGYL